MIDVYMKSVLVGLVMLPTFVLGADQEYVDVQSRTSKMHVEYRLNTDFTVVKTTELEIKALTADVANQLKSQQFSHSTSIEQFEVQEAYTRKSDGTRIPVPEGNYQVTINKGNGDAGAIFSDRTQISIVFPDLEKGDSVYMRIKDVETEPMFPGHFSTSGFFYSQTAYDDVKVRLDLPLELKFNYEVRDMKERKYTENGRKIIELTYQNPKPVKNNRDDFSVWDESKEAGYALSTFSSYEELGKAYAARALPKAKPTNRIKSLAKEIIKKETDKKTQARLLYDWVAINISYAGNCIGVGAVVPHDTDFILDNRMGDCKDHATLLEALYSAVGIESMQALINAGAIYELPELPLVTSVNHVMNYLPEWDHFVDSTNASMPFDQLGISVLDKPVVLVQGYVAGKKTPPIVPGVNQQEVESTMKIQPDGSVVGDIHYVLKGHPAIEARKGWRRTSPEQEKEWIEQIFSSRNNIGSATIEKDDPTPLLSEFKYSFEFNRPDFILPKGTGGFFIAPIVSGPKDVFSYLNYSNEDIEGYDVACGNGYAGERLVYEFPENMKILAKPDDFEINENYIHFESSYILEGNKLTAIRKINDKTPGHVCSPELINRQRDTLKKISESLQSQVIYQH